MRLIHLSNDSGRIEAIVFTEDYDSPADDFVPPDLYLTVDFDQDVELPNQFSPCDGAIYVKRW